jgi:hypothetical protein
MTNQILSLYRGQNIPAQRRHAIALQLDVQIRVLEQTLYNHE